MYLQLYNLIHQSTKFTNLIYNTYLNFILYHSIYQTIIKTHDS